MSNLNDPVALATLLEKLNANDTATIKKAEKALKPFMKQPQCVEHLLNLLRTHQSESIRHHAALLMKKKIGAFYPKYPEGLQNQFKSAILGLLVTEPTRSVGTGIASVIAATAKAIFESNQTWGELFMLLMQLAQDPNEKLRALDYRLLSELSETISSHLRPHVQTLSQMFVMGCQDAVHAVATAALSAVTTFISEVRDAPEIMALKPVISPMLTVMEKCLREGDEDMFIEGMDVIQECCTLEQPLINDHIDVIVQFIISIISNKEAEPSVKKSAGQTLMNIIEFRPKLFAKKNLVGPTLTVLMDMVAKEESSAAGSLFTFAHAEDGVHEEDDDDEDYDEDEDDKLDVQRLVQTIIDTMAIHVPSKYFVDPALALCSQGMSSPDPHMRKAGCAVLGVIAEGCSDKIRENLAGILPHLLAAVGDNEYYVRECACFALGQFSEYCQPDILHYNQQVLPVIFQALDDPRPTVQGTSCYVLEYFCENLQPETLRPYLAPLMTKLAGLLQSDKKTTKEMALTAIAATAVAAEKDFLPFTETICGILSTMLFLTEPTDFTLRGRALECLGHIAVALGKDHFARYFEMGMQSATQGASLNDESLKEHSFVYIANSVKVMGKGFGAYLPSLLPYLLEVIEESELIQVGDEDDDEEAEAAHDEEDDDENDLGNDYRLNVQEGFVNTKKAALTALGAIAEHTQELFYPYLHNAMQTICTEDIGAMYSLHDSLRAEALSILQFFVKAIVHTKHGGELKPLKGQALPLDNEVAQVASVVMNVCVMSLSEDIDKLPVSYACECIVGVLRTIGLSALNFPAQEHNESGATVATNVPIAQPLMKAVSQLLAEKAPCQLTTQHERGEDEEPDEDSDHDQVLIDSVSDLVGELAKVLGEAYIPFFDDFCGKLLAFSKPSRSHSDRAMAIGCFAEVVAELGPAATKYADMLLPIIQLGLQDNMESVRRNTAFCVGVLVESTGAALQGHFLSLLQWLHPLCIKQNRAHSADAAGADVDNAIAAVARMINIAAAHLPLNQILPVMIAALPLHGDTSEGPCVYGCLATLLRQNIPAALELLPQLVAAFGETLSPATLQVDGTKVISREILKELVHTSHGGPVIQSYVQQLTDVAHQQAFTAAMSS